MVFVLFENYVADSLTTCLFCFRTIPTELEGFRPNTRRVTTIYFTVRFQPYSVLLQKLDLLWLRIEIRSFSQTRIF